LAVAIEEERVGQYFVKGGKSEGVGGKVAHRTRREGILLALRQVYKSRKKGKMRVVDGRKNNRSKLAHDRGGGRGQTTLPYDQTLGMY